MNLPLALILLGVLVAALGAFTYTALVGVGVVVIIVGAVVYIVDAARTRGP